ncbi:MAG: PspC domain-containing protein [Roseiflexaceae bacterium]
MQPRLMRSRTEVIIAGVCGGLGEYFGLDPVIVRLIFVLVTLTTGLGFIVYPVLWLVMPKAGAVAGGTPLLSHDPDAWRRRMNEFGQEMAQAGQQIGQEMRQASQQMREVFLREQGQRTQAPTTAAPPPPEAYNFDPLTGQPINRSAPTTGQTINLRVDATMADQYAPPANTSAPGAAPQQPVYYGPPPPVVRRHRGRSIGIVLVAFGALVLAGQFEIAQYVFPILMIGAGLLLLRKK